MNNPTNTAKMETARRLVELLNKGVGTTDALTQLGLSEDNGDVMAECEEIGIDDHDNDIIDLLRDELPDGTWECITVHRDTPRANDWSIRVIQGDNNNPHTEAVTRLLELSGELGLIDEDFDDIVIDCCSQTASNRYNAGEPDDVPDDEEAYDLIHSEAETYASDINNCGMRGQIKFLLTQLSEQELTNEIRAISGLVN